MKERFGVDVVPDDPSDTDAMVELMEAIGRKRGALISGEGWTWKKLPWPSFVSFGPASWAGSAWKRRKKSAEFKGTLGGIRGCFAF
ncbi:hypothetical protein LJK88_22070 [Paenibacillus sp. P26]|nr:hypothetical protein LJK88_22070 [Paenibacillus sp. P26]